MKKPIDFVSVDVETANKDKTSICQIGFAFVENGVLTKTWGLNINPLTEDFSNSYIHGITAKKVQNALTFDQAMNYILPYIANRIIVHHSPNHFDELAIYSAAEKHNLVLPNLIFTNSYFYLKEKLAEQGLRQFGLSYLCKTFDIDFIESHDAIKDAIALAKLILKVDNDNSSSIMEWKFKKKPKPIPEAWKKVSAVAKNEGIFSSCMFALTGTFSMSKQEVADLIAQHGGNVGSSVTLATTHLVVGAPSFSQKGDKSGKLKRALEINAKKPTITILTEDELLMMIKNRQKIG